MTRPASARSSSSTCRRIGSSDRLVGVVAPAAPTTLEIGSAARRNVAGSLAAVRALVVLVALGVALVAAGCGSESVSESLDDARTQLESAAADAQAALDDLSTVVSGTLKPALEQAEAAAQDARAAIADGAGELDDETRAALEEAKQDLEAAGQQLDSQLAGVEGEAKSALEQAVAELDALAAEIAATLG